MMSSISVIITIINAIFYYESLSIHSKLDNEGIIIAKTTIPGPGLYVAYTI